jgi:hypothetical protein
MTSLGHGRDDCCRPERKTSGSGAKGAQEAKTICFTRQKTEVYKRTECTQAVWPLKMMIVDR